MRIFGNTNVAKENKKQMSQGIYRGISYKTKTQKKIIDNRQKIYRGQMQ